jgi:hypothetical protein
MLLRSDGNPAWPERDTIRIPVAIGKFAQLTALCTELEGSCTASLVGSNAKAVTTTAMRIKEDRMPEMLIEVNREKVRIQIAGSIISGLPITTASREDMQVWRKKHQGPGGRSISIDCQTIIRHIQEPPKNSATPISITNQWPGLPKAVKPRFGYDGTIPTGILSKDQQISLAEYANIMLSTASTT